MNHKNYTYIIYIVVQEVNFKNIIAFSMKGMFNTIEQKRHFRRIKVKKTLLKRCILKKNADIVPLF